MNASSATRLTPDVLQLDAAAEVEAFIDFPEEDIAPGTGQALRTRVLRLIASMDLRHELDMILEEEHPAPMLASLAELGAFTAVKPTIPPFDSNLAIFGGLLQ